MQIDAEAKASMSIFDSTSLLSRINRGETDSLDEHIIYNLRLAERFSRLSEGHYDVTVKPLVDTWGFAGHEAERTPNLDSLLQFVGYRRVHIRDGRLVKDDPRVQLDFNSIAKGYTVDLVAALMERCGAKNYLVEIGGECRCQGVSSKGIPWRIGIETPFDGNMRLPERKTKRKTKMRKTMRMRTIRRKRRRMRIRLQGLNSTFKKQ